MEEHLDRMIAETGIDLIVGDAEDQRDLHKKVCGFLFCFLVTHWGVAVEVMVRYVEASVAWSGAPSLFR